MAKDKQDKANDPPDMERVVQLLDMLDRRLDNVDSIVSAVAERVMRQPVTLNLSCPKCGQKIEITLIGTEKMGLK